MRRLFLLAFAVAIAFGAASSQAEVTRIPKAGDPAFVTDVPDGWTIEYDPIGNLRIYASDRSCFIQLSMIIGDEAKVSMPNIAAGIFAAARAEPFSATAPGVIDGHSGTYFMSAVTVPNSPRFDIQLLLVKLDSDHVGSLAIVKGPNVSQARDEQLGELLRLIRVVGR